jgi:hypothetical protein
VITGDSIISASTIDPDSAISRLEDTIKQVEDAIESKKSIDSDDEDIADQIDDDIDDLEDKIDVLEDKIKELYILKSLNKSQDTIDAEYIFNKINEKRIAFSQKVSKSRAQGYGGGLIFQPMVLGLNMKPVHNFTLENSSLRQYDFDDMHSRYTPMPVFGCFAFGGVGNGMRIGFGGWNGKLYFEGERRDGNNDSVMSLNLRTSFGGMFIEKAIVHENLNILLGGVIGGGNYSLYRTMKPGNAFNDAGFWTNFEEDADQAKASFAGMEIHSGLTVSILPWMHLGMDLNTLFSLSVSGFRGIGGSGFTTVNPGARLRIVFGNLG